MNPYDEHRIRDEVIYLHSLWHQGPPQQPPPLLHPHPFPPSHTRIRSLPPLHSTAFKKTKNHNRKNNKRPKPDPPEWSCPRSSDSPQTVWRQPKPRPDPPPPLQPQEKERLSVLQAQNKACKALKEFLTGSGSDDEEEDSDNADDDNDGRLVELEEFFIKVFMEDNELMGYYQRCFENGEFCCFVCGAAQIKSWKKYKDCIGLVQHSISILRTANKKAHRAFGQAVCKVLGWDIHRLPTIVITGEPLRCSTEQGSPKKSVAANDDGKDGSSKTEDIAVSLEHVEDSVEAPPPLQPQEKERLSALQAQNKACEALREFLRDSGSYDEEEDDNDEEGDDEDDSDGRLVEFEEFFIRVFMEDNELMGYYQRCFENGEFCCLVCGAGKKFGKYKDCIGLVQHSISILRTANKKAHMAFGQAVCKVLGWDIHRLPTIVITGEPLRCSTEGNPKKSVADNDDGKDGSSKTENIAASSKDVEDSVEEHVKGADQRIGECSSKEGDIDANVVDIGLDHEGGVDKSISEVINL